MHPSNLEKIIHLRHLLHQQPELSMQESGTIGILQDFLRENTRLEICPRDGWFYALKKGLSDSGCSGLEKELSDSGCGGLKKGLSAPL